MYIVYDPDWFDTLVLRGLEDLPVNLVPGKRARAAG
jgi:hypothetical protein